MTSFSIGKYACHCYGAKSRKIVYILCPLPYARNLLAALAPQLGLNIVEVEGMDWDNDLTPWPAPGAPDGEPPFKGLGAEFLKVIQTQIVPKAETVLGLTASAPQGDEPVERDLVGISLSGLFAMWQWALCDTFRNVVSISGSFWYQDFAQWFAEHFPSDKRDASALLLLGKQEPHTRVPQFRSVGVDTESVVETLRSHGVKTTYMMVPGNHYQHGPERLTMALNFLSGLD